MLTDDKLQDIKESFAKAGITIDKSDVGYYLKRAFSDSLECKKRIKEAMKVWEPSPENIQRIVEMNDGLFERFHRAYDDMKAMKEKLDREIASGEIQVSGYSISVEFFFGYNRSGGIPTADEDTLMMLSDSTQYLFPDMAVDEEDTLPSFEEWARDHLVDELNWNIESLDLPGLEKHHVYMFMHHIFGDAHTFCLADILFLQPEDMKWQVVVDYEKF